jgi:hypothetical protein
MSEQVGEFGDGLKRAGPRIESLGVTYRTPGSVLSVLAAYRIGMGFEQREAGGLWALPGTTAPVNRAPKPKAGGASAERVARAEAPVATAIPA